MSRDGDPPVNEDSGAQPERAPGRDAGDEAAATAVRGTAPPGPEGPEGEAFRSDVRDALAGLAARLDREHERAAHREAVIDRLHEENQRLRRGELQAMLEPVRAALYRLHDQARRESRRLSAPDMTDPPDPRQTALLLEAVADDVADALARLGVERFAVEPGAPYDASRHRPVAVTPVDDPLRDGTVTAVRSDGFEQSGKVLRKAAVAVAKLDGAQGGGAKDKVDDDPETGSNGAGPEVGTGSNRLRGTGRGETMNSGLGTDR
ncbi:nucleotide exchange factor GrpE [Actinomadura sp. KC345]|uniref:nucleotide exchange factor GrpE n=1 Tax=Actinomadura sp. KC345 TaxID=2530371 RepID=UPI0010448473|nr:nucleotide exchange factor GrpE [Actinomadura sp. KC345]TDC55908.1 nucleotide exchange factor GrpE [Actinomadura sp. KC345]